MKGGARTTDNTSMLTKLLRSLVGRIRTPEVHAPDETFWQAARRRSFLRDAKAQRGIGRRRP